MGERPTHGPRKLYGSANFRAVKPHGVRRVASTKGRAFPSSQNPGPQKSASAFFCATKPPIGLHASRVWHLRVLGTSKDNPNKPTQQANTGNTGTLSECAGTVGQGLQYKLCENVKAKGVLLRVARKKKGN